MLLVSMPLRVQVLNGYSLDKSHTFSVNLATDLAKYAKPDADWKQPTTRPYKDLGNLRHWLLNPNCQVANSATHRSCPEPRASWVSAMKKRHRQSLGRRRRHTPKSPDQNPQNEFLWLWPLRFRSGVFLFLCPTEIADCSKAPLFQDQFVVQYEDQKVAVYPNSPADPDPQPVAEKLRWTETVVQWSPQGSYLATFHPPGRRPLGRR